MAGENSFRVVVLSLWAEDVVRTTHFYKDVIGLELFSYHHGDRPHLKVGDGFLTILEGKPSPVKDAEPFPLFALEVADLDAFVTKLQAFGVGISEGVQMGPRSRYIMFNDPAGNLIELVQFNS